MNRRYPSDLTDAQWKLVEPLLTRTDRRGAVRKHDPREILNAILYLNKSGCQWRMLPDHFPPWQAVYWNFRHMEKHGIWEKINLALVAEHRKKGGASPRLAT
jgi:transposase